MKKNGVDFDMFWLDLENSDWGSNHTHNRLFIERLRNAAEAEGAKVGIYTSAWSCKLLRAALCVAGLV